MNSKRKSDSYAKRRPRGDAREKVVRQLTNEFVDGARFFDARVAVQRAIAAANEALTMTLRVPHPGGRNPLGEAEWAKFRMAVIDLDRTAASLFPRGSQTLATLGWSFGRIVEGETWPRRWMRVATRRPDDLIKNWPWPDVWPESFAREAARRGKKWFLETDDLDSNWVEYHDGCKETFRELHRRTGATRLVWKGAGATTCSHHIKLWRRVFMPPPQPLLEETYQALVEEVGADATMKKRKQRARSRTTKA